MHEKDPISEINVLSKMNRELKPEVAAELRPERGNYSKRLAAAAEASFLKPNNLNGTTISFPSVMVQSKKDRLQTQGLPGFSMYVRELKTDNGHLVMFPLHTTGISFDGTPIINPDVVGSYSIVHTLNLEDGKWNDIYSPHNLRADLTFTVDSDDHVTVNGMNPVTPAEYELFDSIVCEFENRAEV